MINSKIQTFWDLSAQGTDDFYFIAEIGNNHNGDIELAKKLIDISVKAGVHCVKFQMRDMNTLYRGGVDDAEDLGVEYTKDLLTKYNLNVKQHNSLKLYAEAKGVDYLCTPWDLNSVVNLEKFGVVAYKVASADFTNLELLSALKSTKKPLILSTGMTTQEDFEEVIEFLSDHKNLIALLHCNSTYPAPYEDIDLRQLKNLRKNSKIFGYSGHERGIAVSLAAYSMGARIIERHVTLDRTMEGPDHAASLEPTELNQLLKGLYEVKASLGRGGRRIVSQGEMINRENLAKSLVASSDIQKGNIIEKSDIKIISPGRGLSPLRMDELVGRVANRLILKGKFFEECDVNDSVNSLRMDYDLKGNWGIPVRYHDYLSFRRMTNAKMWEFHLSYKDLMQDASDLNFEKSESELVVHAPELFSKSHLLDLTSPDSDYRDLSISNMKQVIQQTKRLSTYFKVEHPIKIVTNVGGFSMDQPLSDHECAKRYEILASSLDILFDSDVEIIPQTMAPFPWHFGGQRYQNIFLDADEIIKWCKKLSLRLCFDTSHSKLFCNHKKIPFETFVEKLLPLTAHIHLGDAKSLNGEGLQIGEGDIDFHQFFRALDRANYRHSILPEIWQGHKNKGHGFAIALEKMESLSE